MSFLVASQIVVLGLTVGYALWIRARRSALERVPAADSGRTTAHDSR
jgi:hypothetical protein